MSERSEMTVGSISFSPDLAPIVIDNMAASIVDLLLRNSELEQERDFYKAAATKLAKPKRRRKQ
jgi:hypothetical protein